MTRFARASGSKASNKRIPEEATAWHDLKLKKSEKSTNTSKSVDNEEIMEKSDKLETKWSDFSEKKSKKKKEHVNKGKIEKTKSKFKQNKEEKTRRKPMQNTFIANGREIEIAYMDGFPIKKEDFVRITNLRKEMKMKGLPKTEIKVALKLERRKAEKAFAREKKKVCFNCRKSGHNLSECPQLNDNRLIETNSFGICFKCGSTEHTHFECRVVRTQEFKFAHCFICNEQGHIARQCPDNARGLYPKGGACRVCGDVTHLKKDCPKYQVQQESSGFNAEMMDGKNPDDLEGIQDSFKGKEVKKVNKIVKF